ncbi:MAG TPA: Ldh family oxidoreductase, partial [Tepidiformaceae bacterium]|nr:Ldh family oxidoreductase [Tepidiformaceae bacterium]
MVEVLTSLISGGHGGPFRSRPLAHYFQAYNIDAFTDAAEFKSQMDEYFRALRNCTPAPGHERVVYPGLVAQEEEQERSVRGIPYHPEVLEWFRTTCGELGVRERL